MGQFCKKLKSILINGIYTLVIAAFFALFGNNVKVDAEV